MTMRTFVLILLTIAAAQAATVVVGEPGAGCPGARFREIDSALRAAAPWDEVRLCPGKYRAPAGGLLIRKEGLRLVAAGAAQIVPGEGCGAAVVVTADHVRIEGLEIGGFTGAAAIQVDAAYAEIERNYLHDNGAGIVLGGSGNRVQHNVIRHSRGSGIVVTGGGGNLVFHNLLHHNAAEGIRDQRGTARLVQNILKDNGAATFSDSRRTARGRSAGRAGGA